MIAIIGTEVTVTINNIKMVPTQIKEWDHEFDLDGHFAIGRNNMTKFLVKLLFFILIYSY